MKTAVMNNKQYATGGEWVWGGEKEGFRWWNGGGKRKEQLIGNTALYRGKKLLI
jgi:hypothetical protein